MGSFGDLTRPRFAVVRFDLCFGSFPTRQVRVVRFYKSCPPSPSPRRPPLCHHLRQQYVAMGSAGSQLQAADRSGQRRTSTGSRRSEWAAPDLTSQKKMSEDMSKKSVKTCQNECQKRMPEEMSEDMSEKDVRRNVRGHVRKG